MLSLPQDAFKARLSDFGSSWPSGLCLSPIGLPESCFSAVVTTVSVTFGVSVVTKPFSSKQKKNVQATKNHKQ